ncbi:MAG: zf-HC2 domain-containing protein [Gammaproteobacteria bacterium]|nr:zf-HC2 domain-containing protein [Gammaproteobacteria bacterium]
MKMNCSETRVRLDDYYDDELSVLEFRAVNEHLASCDECKHELQAVDALRQALRDMPVAEVDDEFENRIFGEVRKHYSGASSSRFAAGFMTAMAAGLALWFATSIFIPQLPVDDASQVVMVALNDAYEVRLKFDAPVDLEQVTLSIDLPDNIELEGYADRKELTWQTQLKQGQNILALPLKAVAIGEGELVAQLFYGDKSRSFRVILKTTGNDALIYQVRKFNSV